MVSLKHRMLYLYYMYKFVSVAEAQRNGSIQSHSTSHGHVALVDERKVGG